MRLEILHTAITYPPCVDGVSYVVQTISEKLASRGHRVVVATGQHPQRDFQQLNGVEIREFDILGNQTLGYTGNTQSYIDFLKSFSGDVMMNYAGQVWTSDLVYPLLDALKYIKMFAPCGYSRLNNPVFAAYFEGMPRVLHKYDHIVYHSENYQDKLFGDKHSVQHYSIIPNGALAEEFLDNRQGFREMYGINTSRMFLCVANYGAEKNQEMVLRAYLEAAVPDSTLVFIGSDFNKYAWEQLRTDPSAKCLTHLLSIGGAKLRRHIWNRIFQTHSLRGPSLPGLNVRIFENVPRDMVVSAYHEADLFLYGSQVECFPLVILEAMASRTPFISTDCGNVRELPGGIVVSSAAEMTQTIRLLVDNGTEWSNLAQAGHQRWKQRHQWDKIVDQYERLYLELSSQKNTEEI